MDKHLAFGQFFREHYSALHHYAQRMVEDEEVCRDIVGDALERAWANYDGIGYEKLQSYTYSLVHNKCVDYVRHEMARSRYADFLQQMGSDGNSNDDVWEERELILKEVQRVMAQMTPKTRYVLEQCYLHRRCYADVAAEMGISVSGVKKHIMSALRQLREQIAKKI